MPNSLTPAERDALRILQAYLPELEWSAPERTIHQCRECFLQADAANSLAGFTQGLKVLLERRYVRRLNDERLELTPAGRNWLETHG